jgi:dCMP deaminase
VVRPTAGLVNPPVGPETPGMVDKYSMRTDWHSYFFGIVDAVSQRATCDRGKCATIIVAEKRILSTGYVGAPAGLAHCDDVGHQIRKVLHLDGVQREHCVRTIHAEANAIIQAAKFGVSTRGAVIYTSMFPCYDCAKLIVSAGIRHVYAAHDYQASIEAKNVILGAGVTYDVYADVREY